MDRKTFLSMNPRINSYLKLRGEKDDIEAQIKAIKIENKIYKMETWESKLWIKESVMDQVAIAIIKVLEDRVAAIEKEMEEV